MFQENVFFCNRPSNLPLGYLLYFAQRLGFPKSNFCLTEIKDGTIVGQDRIDRFESGSISKQKRKDESREERHRERKVRNITRLDGPTLVDGQSFISSLSLFPFFFLNHFSFGRC